MLKQYHPMSPILRLAYATQFLIALIAVFVLWSEVGGQGHLDIMPWYWKLVLGGGAAFAVVKATAAAVARDSAWNGVTLKWLGILLAVLLGCGLLTFYAHMNWEDDEPDDTQDSGQISLLAPQVRESRSPDGRGSERGCMLPAHFESPLGAATVRVIPPPY